MTDTGNQLTSLTAGGQTHNYFYDPEGNLDCVTLAAGTQATCDTPTGGTVSPTLVADYVYNYLNRLGGLPLLHDQGHDLDPGCDGLLRLRRAGPTGRADRDAWGGWLPTHHAAELSWSEHPSDRGEAVGQRGHGPGDQQLP